MLVIVVLAVSCGRKDSAVVATKDPTPAVSSTASASASVAPAPSPSIAPPACPNDRDCGPVCCDDGEMCNGTVCYQPLLCGGTLPECPPLTHCEHYATELASSVCKYPMGSNAIFCARMRYGVHILELRVGAKPASGADGGCLPELGDVHRGGRRWYEKIGKHPYE